MQSCDLVTQRSVCVSTYQYSLKIQMAQKPPLKFRVMFRKSAKKGLTQHFQQGRNRNINH